MGYDGSEEQKQNALVGSAKAAEIAHQRKSQRIVAYNENPKMCTNNCGTPLPYEKRKQDFCSRHCAAQVRNPATAKTRHKVSRPKRPWAYGQRGNPEYGQKIRRAQAALWDRRNAEELELWKAGKLRPSPRSAKRLLAFEGGKKCSRCGWSETNPFSHTIPVELEHRDGDCYNNTYENVCLFCPNCHSLTATFRGLNARKGRGRRFYKVVSRWAKEQGVKGIWSNQKMVPAEGLEPPLTLARL